VLAGLAIAAALGLIAGLFAVLFTGEYPEGWSMEEQSRQEFASADPAKGAQDATSQEPRLSPEISLNSRRRLQYIHRPAPPHFRPNASHPPRRGDEHLARRRRGRLNRERPGLFAFSVRQRDDAGASAVCRR
jgi:hypothetical protein